MSPLITGFLCILGGILLIIFRERFARYTISYQNKYLGYNFGAKTVNFGIRFTIFLAMLIIIIGILIATNNLPQWLQTTTR